ncbi:hypothetical protein D9758_012845 [Tetrapyrgos nigripes]|uniref:Uncharacterized protein n=1 Tax=Tetrapyrgos nigripes TaxID=182062 RepID=A0A8H5FIP3_9AGAR|nr:hypothetical protein D9758_012845 [Tetrapyrgos nigripes]
MSSSTFSLSDFAELVSSALDYDKDLPLSLSDHAAKLLQHPPSVGHSVGHSPKVIRKIKSLLLRSTTSRHFDAPSPSPPHHLPNLPIQKVSLLDETADALFMPYLPLASRHEMGMSFIFSKSSQPSTPIAEVDASCSSCSSESAYPPTPPRSPSIRLSSISSTVSSHWRSSSCDATISPSDEKDPFVKGQVEVILQSPSANAKTLPSRLSSSKRPPLPPPSCPLPSPPASPQNRSAEDWTLNLPHTDSCSSESEELIRRSKALTKASSIAIPVPIEKKPRKKQLQKKKPQPEPAGRSQPQSSFEVARVIDQFPPIPSSAKIVRSPSVPPAIPLPAIPDDPGVDGALAVDGLSQRRFPRKPAPEYVASSVSSRESGTSAGPRSSRSVPSLRPMRSVPPSSYSAKSTQSNSVRSVRSVSSSTLVSSNSSVGSASNFSLGSSLALPIHHPPATAQGNAHIGRHRMVLDSVTGLPVAANNVPLLPPTAGLINQAHSERPQQLSEATKAKLRARTLSRPKTSASTSSSASGSSVASGVAAPAAPPPSIPLPPIPSQVQPPSVMISKSNSIIQALVVEIQAHIPTSVSPITPPSSTSDDARSILRPTSTLPTTKSSIERPSRPSPLMPTSTSSSSATPVPSSPASPGINGSIPISSSSSPSPSILSQSLSRTNSSKSISTNSPPTHAVRVPSSPLSPSRWSATSISSSISSVDKLALEELKELKKMHLEEIPAFDLVPKGLREDPLDPEKTPIPSPVTPTFVRSFTYPSRPASTQPLVIKKVPLKGDGEDSRSRKARTRCGTPMGGWLAPLSSSAPAATSFVTPRSGAMKAEAEVERVGVVGGVKVGCRSRGGMGTRRELEQL